MVVGDEPRVRVGRQERPSWHLFDLSGWEGLRPDELTDRTVLDLFPLAMALVSRVSQRRDVAVDRDRLPSERLDNDSALLRPAEPRREHLFVVGAPAHRDAAPLRPLERGRQSMQRIVQRPRSPGRIRGQARRRRRHNDRLSA